MADGARELVELSERLQAIAAAGWAVPIVEALSEEWVDVSQQDVPKDTWQTHDRTWVESVSGTKAHARATVVSDTPYAGYVELIHEPYFTNGRKAAHKLANAMGGSVETEVRRVLVSGGVPNPRKVGYQRVR